MKIWSDEIMAINIPGLVELTVKDIDGVTELFMDAFQEYPKLDAAFPEKEKRWQHWKLPSGIMEHMI